MADLTKMYSEAGASLEVALESFGDEELVAEFVDRFARDTTFDRLQGTLSEGDYDAAFRLVHSMKGVTGMLGFMGLYDRVCALTEVLRPENAARRTPEAVAGASAALEAAYDKTVAALSRAAGTEA